MAISMTAVELMISAYDNTATYNERTEEHYDWPGGAAGATVGLGYDLGYAQAYDIYNDWEAFVDIDSICSMLRAAGLKGIEAHAFVQARRLDVTVTFAHATAEFMSRRIPKEERKCLAALPNFSMLPPDCRGALVSLSLRYGNSGFHSTLIRHRQMHNIYRDMVRKHWVGVPVAIRKMQAMTNHAVEGKRLELEASMFEAGIDRIGGPGQDTSVQPEEKLESAIPDTAA